MACRAVLETPRTAQAYPRPTARDPVVAYQILQGLSRHAIGASAARDAGNRQPGCGRYPNGRDRTMRLDATDTRGRCAAMNIKMGQASRGEQPADLTKNGGGADLISLLATLMKYKITPN
jgi:hypothetical protein